MTAQILQKTLKGFSQILNEQSAECLHTLQKSNNLKIWKSAYLKKKLLVRIVNDYMDKRFSNFTIEYLRENKKFRKTVFAHSYGAQAEAFKKTKKVKNLVTLSL